MGALLRLSKNPLRGFPTGWMQPVAQTHRPPAADDSHTYGLRSIFSGAHVTGENDLILFRASERETGTRQEPPSAVARFHGACGRSSARLF